MSGTGRPRKVKSLDNKDAKGKTEPEETEEKQKETTKKPKPMEAKKQNHTKEKPLVQGTRGEKPIDKQERTPKGRGKALTEQSAEKKTKMQPDTPKDTAKEPPKTTKAEKSPGMAKLPEQCGEKMKTEPKTLHDTTEACAKTKAKPCGGKAKLQVQFAEQAKMPPEQFAEKKTKAQPPKKTAKAPEKTAQAKICASKAKTPQGITKVHRFEEKPAVDSVLQMTLKQLRIRKEERSNAAEVVNEIIKNIIKHLKQKTECFKQVEEPLRTGSYYENLKISNPDEFDVMVPMLVERGQTEPFGDNGAFYSVALKRGNNPLKKFQESGTLCASKMLAEFREEVKKCVKEFKEWEVTKKKRGCPAVTLTTTVQSVTISLDVVLSLKVKSSWPPDTKEGLNIEDWLGRKVKQEYKREPYYLVPKYEGNGNVECDGVLAKDIWRLSFSHIEKAMLRNHGKEKTCCEKGGESCCRKDCLKLLKYLLGLLKETDPSLEKFCSYHAKTTLLHACCSRTNDSDWRASDLSHCFHLLLEDFEGHLNNGVLYNFFIPSQNLLSGPSNKMCKSLAERIRKERLAGFPIFTQQLQNGH